MATRNYSKFPAGNLARQEFYAKLFAFIKERLQQNVAEFNSASFYPLFPVITNLEVSGFANSAIEYSQQVILNWLYGYGWQWEDIAYAYRTPPSSQVLYSDPPFVASADPNVFPSTPRTGFWLADYDIFHNTSINAVLGNPFPSSGRIPSYLEALYYWNPRGLRNTQRVAAFRESNRLLEQYTRRFLIPLFLSNTSGVTDDDLVTLGLRPRQGTHRSPLPPPQIAPNLTVITGQNHDLKVVVTEVSSGGATRLMVRTRGIRGFRVEWRFADETLPQVPSEGEGSTGVLPQSTLGWNQAFSTRFKEWLRFDESDRGRLVELRAAFLNPRLQAGPVSNPVTAIIT